MYLSNPGLPVVIGNERRAWWLNQRRLYKARHLPSMGCYNYTNPIRSFTIISPEVPVCGGAESSA